MTPIPHVRLRAGAPVEQYEAVGPAARVRTMSHVQESLFEDTVRASTRLVSHAERDGKRQRRGDGDLRRANGTRVSTGVARSLMDP